MKTIVSVTSIALERDSRALKFAASIARLGYRSVAVEGERSRGLPRDLPFEVISVDRAPPAAPPGAVKPVEAPARNGPSLRARIREALPMSLVQLIDRLTEPLHSLQGYLRLYLQRNREVAPLLPPADAYYLHSFWQALAVYRRRRRAGAIFLYDAHDANWEPDPSFDPRPGTRLVFRIYEAIERRCARARLFTTVGEGVATLMAERFGRRPAVVRNCHDLRLDEPVERGIREATGVSDADFLLVMSGNAKTGTAIEQALEAMERLPERVHLAFVGRYYDSHRASVERRGLSGRVHLLPPVPPTQVVGFIAGADASPILYWPLSDNYLYALPNGFFHAVAAGLPVLYPPLPEVKALCEEHELGIELDPQEPGSIAAGVTRLLEDDELRAACAANVREARGILSWEREEAVLGSLLERALDGAR